MIAGMAPLLEAVQRNCHIADARHARDMTMCAYLLEMREFYRWEHELPPGAPLPRADVGRWIAEREALWETLAEDDFRPLPLVDKLHPPFAAAAVNEALLPAGLVYGAGIGRFGKPHFFLGRLDRVERHEGLTVLVCGCEHARDLMAIPAALQEGTAIVRREALRQWLWEKVEAWGVKRQPGIMARALAAYGDADDPAAALMRMTDREVDTLILHERGEHAAGRLLGPGWEDMIAGFSIRRAEIVVRAVRDNLADCLSTLPALLAAGKEASLHFWFANFDGLRRDLFPRLATAYEDWLGGDAAPIRTAVGAGADHWLAVARRLLSLDEADIAALAGDAAPVAL